MAKARKVITEDGEFVPEPPAAPDPPAKKVARPSALKVTADEVDACIEAHEAVLTNLIRDRSPPSDGAIIKIIEAISALREIRKGIV